MDIERVWDGIGPLECPVYVLEGTNKMKRAYPRGFYVNTIHKESPGAKAGIKKGDIITKVGGVDIDDINTYFIWIAGQKPKDSIQYEIVREAAKQRKKRERQKGMNTYIIK